MEQKSFMAMLGCVALAVGMVSSTARADLTLYKAAAKTICADFVGEKILQDADVMGKYLEKKLNAPADTALLTGRDIISDLNGANFYCFDQEIMVQYLTSKIPAN